MSGDFFVVSRGWRMRGWAWGWGCKSDTGHQVGRGAGMLLNILKCMELSLKCNSAIVCETRTGVGQ